MGLGVAARVLGGLGALAALGATGCMPKPLDAGAENVRMVNAAPAGCRRVGTVQGRQGGLVTGDATPARDLERGARNDLRNQAFALGADTVEVVRRSGTTRDSFGGAGEPNAVTYHGVAWRCSR